MPHYKVIYFDARGRREFVRIILGAAGVKFEDQRVGFAEWPGLKQSMPWGTMPVLEVDGKQMGQTSAIVRFLDHRYGMLPSGDWEAGLIDSVVEVCFDIFNGMEKIVYHTSDDKKAKATADYKELQPDPILKNMEKFISLHGNHGHCVGSKLTTGDVELFCGKDDDNFEALKNYVTRAHKCRDDEDRSFFDRRREKDQLAGYDILPENAGISYVKTIVPALDMTSEFFDTTSYLDQHPQIRGVLEKVRQNEKVAADLKTRN